MNTPRTYPITTQYFPNLIEDDAVYVDKTAFILPLIAKKSNAQYFFSRPRRFGKSLFLSTMEQVFLGKKDLFKGLYIYDKIDWSQKYPVLRISMDRIGFFTGGLESALDGMLQEFAQSYDINLNTPTLGSRFKELIQKIYQKERQQVVILIDEYDKPIITYLEKNDIEPAEYNRDILKSFFGVLKDSGEYVRFLFITGVSQLSKVSLFSDLNQLNDITLDNDFATLCGFTESELQRYCAEGLERLATKEGVEEAEIMAKIKFWYNGFSWNAEDFVYNPFSTMLLMQKQTFTNYWFESGTPTFLVRLVNEIGDYDFTDLAVERTIYNWHDLRNLDYISIMLQTGYLTFKEKINEDVYRINYPNNEVALAFSKMLVENRLHLRTGQMSVTIADIEKAFYQNNIEKVLTIIANLFKVLPNDFFKQGKAVGENFYHAVIFLIFKILGIKMQVEVSSQQGRIDAVVETNECIYVFEFKKNRKAEAALQQIKERKYAEHFALSSKEIYIIGVAFNLQKRGISDWVIEKYTE